MKKQERDFKIEYSLDWNYGIEISQIKKDIEELEKLGATHIDIQHVASYDCSYIEIDAVHRRIETDEEFEERKKEVEAQQEKNKRRELKQLAKLKLKYGE